jgi:hypothetical protein
MPSFRSEDGGYPSSLHPKTLSPTTASLFSPSFSARLRIARDTRDEHRLFITHRYPITCTHLTFDTQHYTSQRLDTRHTVDGHGPFEQIHHINTAIPCTSISHTFAFRLYHRVPCLSGHHVCSRLSERIFTLRCAVAIAAFDIFI